MSDYTKLKNYLNETNSNTVSASGSLSEGFTNLKSNVIDYFSNNISKNDSSAFNNNKSDDQMETWFKEADKDTCCPALVNFSKFNSY